ncbi:MAG: c-type cytochrome [Planctomycetota bacterium]|jgi:mono/diheme cytochrome c family protein
MNGTQKLLILGIIVAGGLHFLGWSDHQQRNYEVLPDMYDSIPYGSFDANPNFPDGKTAQAPIAGTIARGFAPLHAGGVLLDVKREWKELDPVQQAAWNGLAAPEEVDGDLLRGTYVFETICATCHGAGGGGDGPSTKRGVPPPPALFAKGAIEMSDGRMFRIITAGQANMAPHAAQVARADRWRVIRFVRSLQPK